MNKSGKIITAFALGSAAGAFLGLLLSSEGKGKNEKLVKEEGKVFSGGIKESMQRGKEKKGSETFSQATSN